KLGGPLLAGFIASTRHLLQLLLDDLVFVHTRKSEAARLLIAGLFHLLVEDILFGVGVGEQHVHQIFEQRCAFRARLSLQELLNELTDLFMILMQILENSLRHANYPCWFWTVRSGWLLRINGNWRADVHIPILCERSAS